jgi:hypothetical protein
MFGVVQKYSQRIRDVTRHDPESKRSDANRGCQVFTPRPVATRLRIQRPTGSDSHCKGLQYTETYIYRIQPVIASAMPATGSA